MSTTEVLMERNRCLVLHKLCQDSACPALYRRMVKQGLSVEDAEAEVAAVIAGRSDR